MAANTSFFEAPGPTIDAVGDLYRVDDASVPADTLDTPGYVHSDNSFTLLPGSPRVLTFAADLNKEELERRLEIHDLRRSYQG